ncbi:helix-turn-helix transcriptional regulator [Bacillus sp. RG28]|uniref:Helix-turn-helix transcriptional regulator n=1 Tax=Gottfriedia endophytica TaxID=2820819 RepID=A0A940NHJ5_9BACI|nr:helix-turn-helix transcriptional regulator [Gottfriedia endophytica]MBP0725514.1 helix-turn-helix transcriptional regulator [Gottfriedia endophytica]
MKLRCKLKSIFADRGIRQKEFAPKIGLSESGLSDLVRNISIPKLDTALLIANELDMDVKEIWVEIDDIS